MYVEPNTHLEFFQDLHIDPDYENTIYFPTTQAKDNYFANLTSIKTPKCYYQREKRGYCRVEIPIRNLLDRSYMRFKNDSFEDKWFYAFVLDVEYINNITTEVHYQIDTMMTWCGSYNLDPCFVERGHTKTDDIGDNIVPENIQVNNYVNNAQFSSGQTAPQRSGAIGQTQTDWTYLVVMEPKSPAEPPAGDTLGVYSGLHYHSENTASDLTTYINGMDAFEQARIQGIFYIPKAFVPTEQQIAPRTYTKSIQKPVAGTTLIDSYVPKNNKMYTYPYNYIVVNNTEGESAEFPFEFFATSDCEFKVAGIVGEQTQITLSPIRYRNNQTLQTVDDLNLQMMMKEFPMCAWTIDTFKAFLAQQLVAIPSNAVGAATMGYYNPRPIPKGFRGDRTSWRQEEAGFGAVTSLIGAIPDVIQGAYSSIYHPFEARGANAPLLSCAGLAPYKDFWFYRISVRSDEAERIDNYFTMFGYAINNVQVPERNARPYYTYVKTIGCHVTGSFPAGAQREIEEIFNKGVRFWNQSHEYIGRYVDTPLHPAVDNSPVQQED